jgi:hypothetical protein
MMPFEDLLRPAPPRCKTCSFIANLDPALGAEVAEAVRKPIFSDRVLANGMEKVETEYNQAPGETSIRTHRQKGHAA